MNQLQTTTSIKKRKSSLSNYKHGKEIYIPYTSEGFKTKNNIVGKLKRWVGGLSLGLISAELSFNIYELYSYGLDSYVLLDWMTFVPDVLELGGFICLYTFARRMNKKSFLFEFLGLTDEEIQINLHYKKHRIKIKDVISYRFFTSQYNVNYLIFELKDGKEHKIKWLQTFLIKEQQEVVNDYFEEIDKRIHLPHRNS
ncbi:hypothetical protein MY04_1538 [Flammeovirga sp. MY04]|uniref:hypothetical protein n=1 Tax=Flammeovirga sp. MY04 TaxID=1191459 RepID=UPI0008061F07|nr:hypothetical protein [Flammeovirga sp. MY04]ANQ48914.1 hypothetical protein MY04_1538 [Flammeovirga sp. MY04]